MSNRQAERIAAHCLLHATPDNGVTQREIADALNLSQSTVSRTLNTISGFGVSSRPLSPKGYYFDPGAVVRRRPELIPEQPSVTNITSTVEPEHDTLSAKSMEQVSVIFRDGLAPKIKEGIMIYSNHQLRELVTTLRTLALTIERRIDPVGKDEK